MSEEGQGMQTGRRSLDQEGFVLMEHRIKQLESERLPNRMTAVENSLAQVQAEVTAIKEVANGIGIKLDAGIQMLDTKQQILHERMVTEQTRNNSFIRGALWAASAVGVVIGLGPTLKQLVIVWTGAGG